MRLQPIPSIQHNSLSPIHKKNIRKKDLKGRPIKAMGKPIELTEFKLSPERV